MAKTAYWVWATCADQKTGKLKPYIVGLRFSETEAYRLGYNCKDAQEIHVTKLNTVDPHRAIQAIKGEILALTGEINQASARFSHEYEEEHRKR